MKIMSFLTLVIGLLAFLYSPGFKKFKKDILDNKHIIKKGLGWTFKLTGYLSYVYYIIIAFLVTVSVTEKQMSFGFALLLFLFFWGSAQYFKWLFIDLSKSLLISK